MFSVADVALPRPLRTTFEYSLPSSLPAPLPGTRVRVPLGRSHVIGVVTALKDHSARVTKPIEDILDTSPILTPDLLRLASWLSDYYHHPIGSVYAALMPTLARRGRSTELPPQLVWITVGDSSPSSLDRAPQQRQLWETLSDAGPVTTDEARRLGGTLPLLRKLKEKGAIVPQNASATYSFDSTDIDPTAEQNAAISAITADLDQFAVHTLYGVTGSGKTEVYLRVIENVLKQGKQALVLVPEIALTPQTTARFIERFGAAGVVHSAASDLERFKTWIRVASGEHQILIGTRSAIFSNFRNLGVIVVDEEHDPSFKQTEGLRYSARDVAVIRAQMLGIPCVLGSATPSLETLANVERNRYSMTRISERPGGRKMPTFRIVDVRGKHLTGGLSDPMLAAIRQHLDNDAQVLVFINRRGYAPSLCCSQCGWRANCDTCEARLTLHQVPKLLQCHHCLRRYPIPSACPDCAGTEMVALGAGTQRVEQTLKTEFPDVPTIRVDGDTTRSHARLQSLFSSLTNSSRQILIGTQMLAKGHHLPNVTLVAIVNADNGFLSPDFRGPERTAQLITQVAGRAGRAEKPGEVWIQSYDPANPNLVSLTDHGYGGFTETEMQHRRMAQLPPFTVMAMLRADGSNSSESENFLRRLLAIVATFDVEAMGPVSAPLARKSGRFRHQALLISRRRSEIKRALKAIANEVPTQNSVRWSIDVDPIDTF